MERVFDASTSRHLPKELISVKENYETDSFHYDHQTNLLNCKLLIKIHMFHILNKFIQQ
jgi:hypothetical protein